MEIERFRQIVERLEQESAGAPGAYRVKVMLLTILGFFVLSAVLAAAGLGVLLLFGLLALLAFQGGFLLLLVAKLGKFLILLAIPLLYTLKSTAQALLVRLPAPQGRRLTREEAPALFDALDDMRRRMRGPRFHHVLVVDDMNAAIVQRPMLGLFGWPRNYLLLGLPLLEGLSPEEAAAVVAHEYGHLAGSHGRFSAYIYRMRNTWATVQAYAEHFEGWVGKLVSPLLRWYVPYFNAYTFVLARSDEYRADAAAAELVGAAGAISALKRVNVLAGRHHEFMQTEYGGVEHRPAPSPDLFLRWASEATHMPPAADIRQRLDIALDREGSVADTHPTLRRRLEALGHAGEATREPPAPLAGPSAATAWFGPLVAALRDEFQAQWVAGIAQAWKARYEETEEQREKLASLRAMPERSPKLELDMLELTMRLEATTDIRDALAAFNAAHPRHGRGLYLEGRARLDEGDREGLALLDRAMEADEEVIKPACERAHEFLVGLGDAAAAEAYAERWSRRHAVEAARAAAIAG